MNTRAPKRGWPKSPMKLTPEEIENIRRIRERIAEIDLIMEKLRPGLTSNTLPEYIDLNRERDGLDRELGED